MIGSLDGGLKKARPRRLAVPLTLLVAFLNLAPPVAAEPVPANDPQTLSDGGQNAENTQVAVDRSGNALIVWSRFDGANTRIQARARAADGTLGPVQDLSASGQDANHPQVAIDINGTATVVWRRSDGTHNRIQARSRTADGTLGPVQTLSDAGQSAANPQLALDSNGTAVVVWSRLDGSEYRVQARTRSSAGVLGTVQTLSGSGRSAYDPQVALDGSDNATVVWHRYDGANYRIQARARSSTGTLSTVQTLSDSGQNAFDAQVAADGSGNATVVWYRSDGTHTRIQARARTAGGTLSTVQTLSAAGQDAMAPQVAIGGDGKAVAVWQRSDGTNSRIQARTRSAVGTLSAVQAISRSGQNAYDPQVALDGAGNATVAWSRSDGSNSRIEARTRSAAGTLSAVQTLSASGRDAYRPQLAVDRAGNAVVAWFRFDGAYNRIQSSFLLSVQTLSDAGRDADSPQVAVDGSGKAIIVWRRFDGTNYRIQLRARSAAGKLGPVQTLSDGGQDADSPQVAVDGSGNALVVWSRFDGTNWQVQARARSAAGVLGAVETLSASGRDADSAQVAVEGSGKAVVVWVRHDGTNYRIQARARSAGGVLSAVQTLSGSGQDAFAPQVAVDMSGNALVVWGRSDGSNLRIQVRARSAAGTLSAVQTLSASGRDAAVPQLAVDGSGAAVLVWQRHDGSNWRIQSRARSAAGTLGAVQTLSASGQNAYDAQVGLDGSSNAIVVWQRFDSTNWRIQARSRSAGGTLGIVQALSHAGQDASAPQVSVSGSGNAVVTWSRNDGTSYRIQARALSAAGALGSVLTLSGAGQNAYDPQVALDGGGNAVVTWDRYDGSNERIQAGRLLSGLEVGPS